MIVRLVCGALVLCLAGVFAAAQKGGDNGEIFADPGYRPLVTVSSPELQAVLRDALSQVTSTIPEFKVLNLSATLIDLRGGEFKQADIDGNRPMYPASVVKMFYMAALQRQFESGRIKPTPELERGLRDMIVESSNDATQYIVDVLTGTSSGPEMREAEFNAWQHKRNRMNRYFASLGYTGINVNQKTFCEDAYGVEQQSRQYSGKNRNMLTTNATARLMAEIVLGRIANKAGTSEMKTLLKREPFAAAKPDLEEDQARGFIGKALIDGRIAGAQLWSKAGWMSTARHDAAYVETPDGLRFVLVIFTQDQSKQTEAIPVFAGKVIEGLRRVR